MLTPFKVEPYRKGSKVHPNHSIIAANHRLGSPDWASGDRVRTGFR
ncbi:MAG: hypothetical protein MI923_02440 [Phycisphaerales bacterium]|nr:hypothetical protein [Phycisphaerales bacterium]